MGNIDIDKVQAGNANEGLFSFMELEVWPSIPEGVLGKCLTREEEDGILGYGPDGC